MFKDAPMMRLVETEPCLLIFNDQETTNQQESFAAIFDDMVSRKFIDHSLAPELLESILRRDELGPTAIGEGVAIPHTWHPGLDRVSVVLGVSRKGLDYSSLDGEPVHIVLMILTPVSAEAEAVKQRIFDVWIHHLRNPAFRASLLLATSIEDLREAIRAEDRSTG